MRPFRPAVQKAAAGGRARVVVVCAVLSALLPTAWVAAGTVVISQVYGGGGNSGATWKRDFIELFNPGTEPVDLGGWSVQYASATASTWLLTPLSGSIAPGGYYLIAEREGGGGTADLPEPDATGNIAMSASSGKVALVSHGTALSDACPTLGIVDLVGYGSANCSETSPTLALANTTAAVRNGDGCLDTNHNSTDFTVAGPNPRNSLSPPHYCSPPTELGVTLTATPNPAKAGAALTLTATVNPGANPASTGLAVTGDLSALGGSATQTFNATEPGAITFTYTLTISPEINAGPGNVQLGVTATARDDQARTATDITLVTVRPAGLSGGRVVISQIYGGGGNLGSPWQSDFVELFNRSASIVDLTGWTLQYTAQAGGSWQTTPLGGVIPPGGYYLVKEADGNSCGGPCGNPLPTPDAGGLIAMHLQHGKVALVSGPATLVGSCPTAEVVDMVGYGTGTDCFEGSSPTGIDLNNATAVFRQDGGCTDTEDNALDFDPPTSPLPRNSENAARTCELVGALSGQITLTPDPAYAGATVTIAVAVSPAIDPLSTDIAVVGDLSALGGSAVQGFMELAPGTSTFTYSFAIPCGLNTGTETIEAVVSASISDAQGRTATAQAIVTVRPSGIRLGLTLPPDQPPDDGQPVDVTVCTGQSAAFSARAEGPGLTYAWYCGPIGGGTRLHNGDRDGRISGADSSTLQITNVALSDAGSYYAIVSGACPGELTTRAATLTAIPADVIAYDRQIVINQIYGGGGEAGAPYRQDFIELYNRGTTTVNVTGWSMQYAIAAGADWQQQTLLGTIAPGEFYLVAGATSPGCGGGTWPCGSPLPSFDLGSDIAVSAISGQVAIVKTTAALPTSACAATDCRVVDFVGYGAATNCFDGSGPAPAMNSVQSISRVTAGFDSDNNAGDFVAGAIQAVHLPPSASADFNGDGYIDDDDYDLFAACWTGPAVRTVIPDCVDKDLDADHDVDAADFGLFQKCFRGDFIPASPDCLANN